MADALWSNMEFVISKIECEDAWDKWLFWNVGNLNARDV